MTPTHDHWTDAAACVDHDVHLFRDDQPKLAAAATIRRFCHRCPVTTQCRQKADATRSVGIWGARLIIGWPRRYARTADQLDGGATRRTTAPAPTHSSPSRAPAAAPAPRPTAAEPTSPTATSPAVPSAAAAEDKDRGTCRACAVVTALRGDGRVHKHKTKAGRECWGAGYFPEERAS